MANVGGAKTTESDPVNVLVAAGVLNPDAAVTELYLGDGRVLRVSTKLLEGSQQRMDADDVSLAENEPNTVVPVVEEQLHVGKRVVDAGTVRVIKTVEAFDAVVDEALAVRTYEVERVPVNQPVEEVPQVRQEGTVTIFPVVEEQAIVTKRLVLKEEIRVTQRDTERRESQTVTLRREVVAVEREPGAVGVAKA